MQTKHIFTREEAITALKEKHNLKKEDFVEIEGAGTVTFSPSYTYPNCIPCGTNPFPYSPQVWC